MTVQIKRAYDFTRVCRQKGRNYAEIDGIRVVFEDGRVEGWYDPGPEETEPNEPELSETPDNVPSEDSVA